ncbi:MAG: heavy metal translocating P-type ATPase [Propionibacteriaceae bacterium]|nr:heavy metal translocating P-type ATPase [Propionibacteriaceae bacterium]
MTCASCAARIEKKLGKLPEVTATVNLATERALVTAPPDTSIQALITVVEAAGYTARVHAPAPAAAPAPFPVRLAVSAVLALPVAVLAMVPPAQFPGWQWVSLGLATPVALWGAWPFHRAMAVNLRHGTTTMDTLVSLGVVAAYGWSVYALLFGGAGAPGMRMGFEWRPRAGTGPMTLYLEVASVLTVLILTGRFLEDRATRRSSAAIRALLSLGAKEATVRRDGQEIRIAIDRLSVGDEFIVRAGEQIATDGVVIDGCSAVDQSLLTGESAPRDVGPGDQVVGATLNTQGRLVVRATRIGADTQLAQMGRLIEQAQTGKAPVQRLADRVAAVFVPVVIGIAVATLVGWSLVTRDATQAFAAAVAVLVIACPCALGLATPAALMVGTGRGAQLGILIKGPEILESSRRIDTIVLDKTGTLTTGRMAVVEDSVQCTEVRRVAAALEAGSPHPIAQAIAVGVDQPPPVTDFRSHGGLGVEGVVDGRPARAGRLAWVREWATVADDTLDRAADAEARGHTVVAIAWSGAVQGLVELADTVKPTSAQAVAEFRRQGVTPYLLTGDNAVTARTVAAAVGIDHVLANQLPADKVRVVAGLQAAGHVVAMAGDGINDAAALAQADLGIAMGAGTDVAIEASDITLVRSDLLAAVDAVRLSRATLARIKTNLFWAFAYNVAAIPLAVAGLLNPMIAGAAMASSSVFVLQNSLWLRRFAPTVAEPRCDEE